MKLATNRVGGLLKHLLGVILSDDKLSFMMDDAVAQGHGPRSGQGDADEGNQC